MAKILKTTAWRLGSIRIRLFSNSDLLNVIKNGLWQLLWPTSWRHILPVRKSLSHILLWFWISSRNRFSKSILTCKISSKWWIWRTLTVRVGERQMPLRIWNSVVNRGKSVGTMHARSMPMPIIRPIAVPHHQFYARMASSKWRTHLEVTCVFVCVKFTNKSFWIKVFKSEKFDRFSSRV